MYRASQDIHQNSSNFKYFSVVIVPFLCVSIFFILSRRDIMSSKKKGFLSPTLTTLELISELTLGQFFSVQIQIQRLKISEKQDI
jgi:hypothetical protein